MYTKIVSQKMSLV